MNTTTDPTTTEVGNDSFVWSVGQRVLVTRGGHRGETGRVRDVRLGWNPGGMESSLMSVYTITLDTGTLLYMPARCLKAVA